MRATIQTLLDRMGGLVGSRRAVMAAEIVLVCAIAVVAGGLTWAILPGGAQPVDTGIDAVQQTSRASGGGTEVDLASLHLFGESRAGTETRARTMPEDVPDTRLNLRLHGVFATGEGNGLAIIAAGNAEEAVYTVGDRVAGQARVEAIYGDRVILEREGSLETLRLAADEVDTRPASSGARAAAAGNRDVQRIAERASELRARLMKNPLELARMVRFQPYLRDGELVGYRLQPRAADAELLAELGLKPTDVITAVNGVELSDPAKAQQVLRRLQSAETISVSWLRDGEQRQMTIPIGSTP